MQGHAPLTDRRAQDRRVINSWFAEASRSRSVPKPPRLGWMLSSTSVISSEKFGEAAAIRVSDGKCGMR